MRTHDTPATLSGPIVTGAGAMPLPPFSASDDLPSGITALKGQVSCSPNPAVLASLEKESSSWKGAGWYTGILASGLLVSLAFPPLAAVSLPLVVGAGVVGGSGAIATGIGYTKWFFNAQSLRDSAAVSKNIADIISDALPMYENGNTSMFFEKFSQFRYRNESGELKSVLPYIPGVSVDVKEEIIIQLLLRYHFRPDGIAYLLLTIADSLINKSTGISSQPATDLRRLAIRIFEAIEAPILSSTASELDNQIESIIRETSSLWGRRTSTSTLPPSYFKDKEAMSFTARLLNLSRLATAAKNSVEKDLGNLSPKIASQSVISGEPQVATVQNLSADPPDLTQTVIYTRHQYAWETEAQKLREEIGLLEKQKDLKTIDVKWRKYSEICLKYVNLLHQLSRFRLLIDFIKSRKFLLTNPISYHYLISSLLGNKCYEEAMKEVEEGLKLFSTDTQLQNDHASCSKMIDTSHQVYIQGITSKASYTFGAQSVTRANEQSYYDILAIDGGGIKGVIPAIWLAEIEKRAKKPIASLVNMLAGSSTGAILAGGLSLPSDEESRTNLPRYRAADLVEIYTNPENSEAIFRKRGVHKFLATTCGLKLPSLAVRSLSIFSPTYAADGRAKVIKKYTKDDDTISKALTDIVITAVRQNDSGGTYLFTKETAPHVRLYDALMASSAAPIYFPAHTIGSDTFIDGAVTAKTPARHAYDEACKKVKPEKIRIWSLGTGNFIRPSEPSSSWTTAGAGYWAPAIFRTVTDAHESDTDRFLLSMLKSNYYRWQLWNESDCEMDDVESIPDLLDQVRYSMEQYDEQINRCVETLLGPTPSR